MKKFAVAFVAASALASSLSVSANPIPFRFPHVAGNYFHITGTGAAQRIEVAVVKENGGKPAIISAPLSDSAALGGESLNFGDCGSIPLAKQPIALPITNPKITKIFLMGSFDGICPIYPTPIELVRAGG